jgi:hypothetical protein
MEVTATPSTPAQAGAPRRQINWSMYVRIGLIVGIVLFFVGYALKETFNLIWQGGVVDRGQYFEVDLKSMSNFEMDQRMGTLADIPEHYRKLDGKKVLLQGEMAPADFSLGRGSDFLLCYSVAKCCFGGPPKVQHFVSCKVAKNVRELPGGQMKVFGTLHVKVKKEGELITSIYQLDVENVEPVS